MEFFVRPYKPEAWRRSGVGVVQQQEDFKPDYNAVRAAIADLLDSNPDYDDGSYGPVLVR